MKTVIALLLALFLAAPAMADSGIKYTGDKFLFCMDDAPLKYMQMLSNQDDVQALEKYIKAVTEADTCRLLHAGLPFYKLKDSGNIALIRIPGEYHIFYTFGWMLTNNPPKATASKNSKRPM